MTDSATIAKVAKLAKIGLTPTETEMFQKDLTRMLEFVSALSSIPTEGIEPLVNPAFLRNALRSDEVVADGTVEEILSNAPLKDQNMFLVPKIVEVS